MADQPEALRLADALETPTIQAGAFRHKVAAELRRLYEENQSLRAALAEPKEKPWRCACGANLYIDENGAPRSKA